MATGSELLLAFYGDDFTGSTDAMEALALSGLRTVLFLSPPTPEFLLRKFSDLRCIGVAGTSRAMSPTEMDAQLEPVLRELWALRAPLTHYKVCSTFDSAPHVGSIGHVADMARAELTPDATLSVVAGAPPLRRYTVFGNHFAAAGEEVFRLDRHPTMSRHPVTPMHEADLRIHLSHQTQARIGLMSLPELAGDEASVDTRHAQKLDSKPNLLLYDVADDQSLRTVGRLIWQQAQTGQGVEVVWGAAGDRPGFQLGQVEAVLREHRETVREGAVAVRRREDERGLRGDARVGAELEEARTAPVEVSVTLLDALHRRWVLMLRAMSEADFSRAFLHPNYGWARLDATLGLYAWHGRHHVAHITSLRERMGW